MFLPVAMPKDGTLFNWLYKTEEKKETQGVIEKLRQDYIDMTEAKINAEQNKNDDYMYYILLGIGALLILSILGN